MVFVWAVVDATKLIVVVRLGVLAAVEKAEPAIIICVVRLDEAVATLSPVAAAVIEVVKPALAVLDTRALLTS